MNLHFLLEENWPLNLSAVHLTGLRKTSKLGIRNHVNCEPSSICLLTLNLSHHFSPLLGCGPHACALKLSITITGWTGDRMVCEKDVFIILFSTHLELLILCIIPPGSDPVESCLDFSGNYGSISIF